MTPWPTTLDGFRDFLRKLDLAQIDAGLREWANSIRASGPVATSAVEPDLAAIKVSPPSMTELQNAGRRHGVNPNRASYHRLATLYAEEVNLNMDPAARARYVQLELLKALHKQLALIPEMIVFLSDPVPKPAAIQSVVHVPSESGTHGDPCNLVTNHELTAADVPNRNLDPFRTKIWWPRAAAHLIEAGTFSSEIPRELLLVELDLYGYLKTRARIVQQHANWKAYFITVSETKLLPSRQRIRYRRGTELLRHWVVSLDRFAEEQIASWFTAIEATHKQLSGESSPPVKGSLTMPPAIATSSTIASLAADISARITSGQGGRLQVSGSETAFAWGVGLPTTLLNFVPAAQVGGRHVDTVLIRSTTAQGVTIAHVDEDGQKPRVATMTSSPVELLKYAAIATISTEAANFVSSIEQALVQVMGTDLVRAIEKALADELTTAAGVTVTGTDDMAADIIQAIASIAANGGQASVLALSPVDYVTLMTKQGASGSYLSFTDPAAGPGQFFGLTPCIVPTLTTALVLDPRGAITYEVAGGPLAILDIGSQLSTNGIQLAIETWCAPKTTSPGVIAKLTAFVGP